MRAIYIILMGLPCWARLSRWLPLRVALPNFWGWISFTDLGLSVNCNRVRPSAKLPWYGSAIGQILVVFAASAKFSAVSAKWVIGLVIRPNFLSLSQVPLVSTKWTRPRASRWARPRPYRYNLYLNILKSIAYLISIFKHYEVIIVYFCWDSVSKNIVMIFCFGILIWR